MDELKLYRKRLIPDECILLKDDRLLYRDDHIIVTAWDAIHPKPELHHGFSCYFLDDGLKVSQFYRSDDSLRYWYCDIIDHEYSNTGEELVVTDLLADVILYPDGTYKVVDLDELADAHEQGLISGTLLERSLRRLNRLLTLIYENRFHELTDQLEAHKA